MPIISSDGAPSLPPWGWRLWSSQATLTGVPSFIVSRGATLALDETAVNLDCLSDVSLLTMRGGTLQFDGSALSTTERVGQLNAAEGESFIQLGGLGLQGAGGILELGSLTRPGRSGLFGTLDILCDPTLLGIDYRVLLSTGSAGLPSWVKVNHGVAKYDPTYGIVAASFIPPVD